MLRLDLNLVWTMVNLLLLFFLVKRFLFRPIHKILEARQAEIDRQYADAKTTQESAQILKRQYETAMADVAAEEETVISEAKTKAEREYIHILEEAEGKAHQILAEAEEAADREWEKRMQQAKEELADLVVSAVTKVVYSNAGEMVDQDLYGRFLAGTGEGS
ncbi:MAG: F0F1 ATP synthase subunit B [Clostridium sp.]|jgi:F-type H+-transporting ATPase subunit b|nr:F0F1 ATP synthase subunit B [Clostridium sp.]